MSPAEVGAPLKEYWESETCGTHFAKGAPLSRSYFEEIEERRYRLEPFIHSFAQFTRWHAKRVLEVGVGAGSDFLQFARAGANLSGVDLTFSGVNHVLQRFREYGLPVPDVRQADATHLPFEDEEFDLVYSWGVIHHAQDTWGLFREIYRVTRPGGTIKIMVYNLNSTTVWLKWLHHAVAKGRLTKDRAWALRHFQESYGTKGYTERQIRGRLAEFPHAALEFSYYDDVVEPGPYASLFRFLRATEPRRMRWFIAFQLTKR